MGAVTYETGHGVHLAMTMVGRAGATPGGYLLAALVGLTWASNAVGGGTVVFSPLALVTAAFG